MKLLQILLEQDQSSKLEYKVIGFANKYYTLWEVDIDDNIIVYTYIRNLSFDLEDAKRKAGTDKFEETLRGRSKTFTKIKYDNGSTQEFEDSTMSKILSSRMTFGKYQGEEIIKVANKDPRYLAWVITDTRGNTELKKILSTLDPVKKLLATNTDYSEREKSTTDFITSLQNDFEQYYGISPKWKEYDRNKYILKSTPITLTATLKTPMLAVYDHDKKKSGNEITNGYKKVTFDQIPDKEIKVDLKRERLGISPKMVAVVQGVSPEAYGTPRWFDDFAVPENMKDAKYELKGYFEVRAAGNLDIKDRVVFFRCSTLKLA